MEFFARGLSLVIFLPMLGGLALLLIPRQRGRELLSAALAISLATFLLSLELLREFDPSTAALQFVERRPWIPSYGIHYFVGIDGLSLFLFLLTAFLSPIVILASWTIRERIKEYLFFMLVLETGMLGTFAAMDLFLFYVFWEVMLVPMYFLIGVWGGPRRTYAAVKFVIYTMSGSLLMLVAIIYLAAQNAAVTQEITFDLVELYRLNLPYQAQIWLFLAFGLSFAIKVPIFPLHTWLPDAHVEAPTAGSVILAGILLKMGTYGFLRFAIPLFPDAALAAAPFIVLLSVIGIVYGALVAMMQEDLKRLVAYTSVSHLGFVMLGLFAMNLQGVQGALFQMLSHGLTTGALFLLVGMIYERRHTRLIGDFGGLWNPLPIFSASFLLITLSSVGLPGLNGFVGEFLILLGALREDPLWAAGAGTGIVLGAITMLWMFRRVFFGPPTRTENRDLKDVGWREILILAPILVLVVWMGIYPSPFLDRMKPSIEPILEKIESKRQSAPLIQEQRGPRKARSDGN